MAIHSHSSLALFEACPRRWFYRHVARIQVPDPMETIECFLGNRLHETLAHFYDEHRRGLAISLPNLARYYRRAWHRHWRAGIDTRGGGPPGQWLSLGERCLARYYRLHQPFRDAVTVGVEQRLEFPLEDVPAAGSDRIEAGTDVRAAARGTAHLVIGYADRIARRADGTWEIHDYKSGTWDPTQAELDADRQLAIYQVGLRRQYGPAGDVELVWHFLESGRTARSRRSDGQLAALRAGLLQLITDIESRRVEGDFPARPGAQCAFCEFRRVCPDAAEGEGTDARRHEGTK